MKKISANELQTLLAKQKVTFTFEKQNGESRTMTATTNPELLEGMIINPSKNEGVFTVYDLEEKGFRSIRKDITVTI